MNLADDILESMLPNKPKTYKLMIVFTFGQKLILTNVTDYGFSQGVLFISFADSRKDIYINKDVVFFAQEV